MAQRIGILVICDNKVGLEGQVVVRNFGGGGGGGGVWKWLVRKKGDEMEEETGDENEERGKRRQLRE